MDSEVPKHNLLVRSVTDHMHAAIATYCDITLKGLRAHIQDTGNILLIRTLTSSPSFHQLSLYGIVFLSMHVIASPSLQLFKTTTNNYSFQ